MDREEFKKKMRSNDTAASKLEVKKAIGDILKRVSLFRMSPIAFLTSTLEAAV